MPFQKKSNLLAGRARRRATVAMAIIGATAVWFGGAGVLHADVFVTESANSTVYDYALNGSLVSSRSTGGDLYGIAADASNNLYVADFNGGILKFSGTMPLASTTYGYLAAGASSPFYYGVALDPSNNLFFTTDADNGSSSDLKTFKYTNATGTPALFADTGANTSDSPRNTLAVDPTTGNVFVADPYNSRVLEYAAANGTLLKTFTTNVSNPTDVAVDSLGNFYSANSSGSIYQINITTGNGTPIATGLNGLKGIAVDGVNDLYYLALDSSNKYGVFEMTAAGVSKGELFSTGSTEIDFIAVNNVPEPATASIMLLGAGLALGLRRSRQRSRN